MWPGVDPSALDAERRTTYQLRENAVQAYLRGTPLAQIERDFGVNRGTLQRLIERCLTPHADGRIQGLRALIPHTRAKGCGFHHKAIVALAVEVRPQTPALCTKPLMGFVQETVVNGALVRTEGWDGYDCLYRELKLFAQAVGPSTAANSRQLCYGRTWQ
jgi:hypothetical protein